MADNKSNTTNAKSASSSASISRITKITLIACVVIFGWYILSDRYAPYTNVARAQALVVPIVPKVSGYVTDVNVRLHSVVSKGDVLFEIDKKVYKLAVAYAEAKLDDAGQEFGALTANVKSAAARVGAANAQLDHAQRSHDRVQQVVEENAGALAQVDRDLSETTLAQARAGLTAAEATLEEAKQQAGESGPDNSHLKAAIVALEKAQMNLAYTSVRAPSAGVIESFNVDVGHYSQAGQPLALFISMSDAWIQADMRENNLGHIEQGDKVEFTLDVAPGRVFKGTVRSIGFGVSSGARNTRGDLPTISAAGGWLREQQRFPVIIEMQRDAQEIVRSGGQANVIVYSGNSFILNTIGWAQIRISSWLSFVR